MDGFKQRLRLCNFECEEKEMKNHIEHGCAYKDSKGNLVARLIFKLNTETNEVWLTNLFITEKYRGCDLAYQLLDVAIDKYNAVGLMVNETNKIAIHTYLRYGFKFIDNSGKLRRMRIDV